MESASFIAAVMVGFLGGVHCIGMCGGIVGAMSLGFGKSSGIRSLSLILSYNLGRIFSYTLAGFLAGGLGLLLVNTVSGEIIQTGLNVVAALILFALGLYLAGFWSGLIYVEKLGSRLWRYIQPLAAKFLTFNSMYQGFIGGMLWGWLPCGLVYAILVWSLSSADPWLGAWYMLGFGLGTLPNLFAFGLIADKIRPSLQAGPVRITAGMLLLIYALYKFYIIFKL